MGHDHDDKGRQENEYLCGRQEMTKFRSAIILTILFLLGISLGSQALAEEASQTYSGDLWSRLTLTGDWGGTRNDLAKKGVTFDITAPR